MLSVLQQDYPALQLRVYDNASGDETAAVVAEFARHDNRIHYHCHEQNIGGLANFQFGLARVDTPYFSFLSDDDYLLPGFLRASAASLDESAEAIFWAGLTLRLDGVGGFFDARLDKWDREGLFYPPDGMLRMLRGDAPCWTGTLFRRQVVDEIGLLDEKVGGPADLDYMLRAAARHPYIVSKTPVAVFTMNPDSFSETAPLSAFWPGWLKMIENIEAIDTLSAVARKQVVEALHADASRMLFRRAARALAKGDYEFARKSAHALRQQYGMAGRDLLLRTIASVCEHVPLTQRTYTAAHRAVERQMVRKRGALAEKYAGVVRPS
jgi:glycosyltransferase involved in cell wall biosynthesis